MCGLSVCKDDTALAEARGLSSRTHVLYEQSTNTEDGLLC